MPATLAESDLDAKFAREQQSLRAAISEAEKLVASKVEDAVAHSVRAVTDALRSTAEGRPTIAKVKQSPSYQAALNRLDELTDALVGQVEDFALATYADSWRYWCAALPADVLRPRIDPDRPPSSPADRSRTWPLHGMTLRDWIGRTVLQRKAALKPILAVAGNRATPEREGKGGLTMWGTQTKRAVLRAASVAFNDRQGFADRLAGRDVLQPERVHPDPNLPPAS